jgi:hypothetical protein
MAPRRGLCDGLNLLDVMPERIEQCREIGLGVEHIDRACPLAPVPRATGPDRSRIGPLPRRRVVLEDLPALEELHIAEPAVLVAPHRTEKAR